MKFIITNGHGYLQITHKQLKTALDCGFKPTQYSFIGKSRVLLEEDCDAPRYLSTTNASLNGVKTIYQQDIRRDSYERLTSEVCNYMQNHAFARNSIGV